MSERSGKRSRPYDAERIAREHNARHIAQRVPDWPLYRCSSCEQGLIMCRVSDKTVFCDSCGKRILVTWAYYCADCDIGLCRSCTPAYNPNAARDEQRRQEHRKRH